MKLQLLFLTLVSAGTDVDGGPVLALGDVVPIDEPDTYWPQLHSCPEACTGGPELWGSYRLDDFALCKEPLLLDFALHNPTRIKACSTTAESFSSDRIELVRQRFRETEPEAVQDEPRNQTQVALPLARGASASTSSDESLLALLQQLARHVQSTQASHLFGFANGTVAGVYTGSSYSKKSTASLLSQLADTVEADGASSLRTQLCSDDSTGIIGVAVDVSGDLAAVQEAVIAWNSASCVDIDADSEVTVTLSQVRPAVSKRAADCKTITVGASELCGRLAQRCGISTSQFLEYNPEKGFCNTLQEGQRVCCTAGDLPDIRPPAEDGKCSPYLVKSGDSCAKLAVIYNLEKSDLEDFNDGKTWGWNGCDPTMFFSDIYICLSDGDPPMPAPVSNAVCGPLKPGSRPPGEGEQLEDLNPCPLNACCNIWGQCGISGDFCTEGRGPTDNPGTAPKGVDGCVSSCGMEITNKDDAPSSFGRVGYYESWNFNRDCLYLRSGNANTDQSYTHMHWAFIEINTGDWAVKLKDDYEQWDGFKQLDLKRVISFGGWGYSTEPETYDILRQAMSPANRATFAANVVEFLRDEGLDGVDFDWEYPGATDIPGTPPGFPSDTADYLKFLTIIKDLLPDEMSVSIAAPASFWYLKPFPIKKMAEVLDYIVFMTYDLHGQWDVGNEWAMEGCKEGNCLRSHVNLTETEIALAMITKAGVPTKKIFVGESSYGRSFKMAEAGCDGPMCRFLGERLDSPAAKGECTATGGYISNAEINRIIALGENVKTYYDKSSSSDVLVYDDVEWVAYLKGSTKFARRNLWTTFNFAGTIDWAVDLQSFGDEEWTGPGDAEYEEPTPEDRDDCTGDYDTISSIPDDAPTHCRNLYILQSLRKMLNDALDHYDELIDGGYDRKFDTYSKAVARSGNSQVENYMFTKGNDYFECTVTERYTCCEACYDGATVDDPDKWCRYCEDFDCGESCDGGEGLCFGLEYRFRDIDMGCPPDYSRRSEEDPWNGRSGYSMSAVTWHFRDGKEDEFWADLYTEIGITEEDIEFKNVRRWDCLVAESAEECAKHDIDYNFPVANGYTEDDVLDPKDVVSEAREDLKNLGPDLDTVISQIKMGAFVGSDYDLVDALALPISMIADSVDNMQTIDDTVDEWDEEKRKSILLAFLTGIFMLVPVIGEVLGAVAALANVARIVALVGAAGNIALGIYDVVDNPDNAPLAIFGLILEPLALLDVAKMGKAADLRRGMSAEDLKKLNAGPGSRVDEIAEANNVCRLPTRKRNAIGALPMSSLNGITYHAVPGF